MFLGLFCLLHLLTFLCLLHLHMNLKFVHCYKKKSSGNLGFVIKRKTPHLILTALKSPLILFLHCPTSGQPLSLVPREISNCPRLSPCIGTTPSSSNPYNKKLKAAITTPFNLISFPINLYTLGNSLAVHM